MVANNQVFFKSGFIPRKSYPNQFTGDPAKNAFARAGVESKLSSQVGSVMSTVMAKQAVDERINYLAIEKALFAGGGGGNSGYVAIIGSYDTPPELLSQADFIAVDGDNTALFDTVLNTSKGRYLLLPGTYDINGEVKLTIDITLQGVQGSDIRFGDIGHFYLDGIIFYLLGPMMMEKATTTDAAIQAPESTGGCELEIRNLYYRGEGPFLRLWWSDVRISGSDLTCQLTFNDPDVDMMYLYEPGHVEMHHNQFYYNSARTVGPSQATCMLNVDCSYVSDQNEYLAFSNNHIDMNGGNLIRALRFPRMEISDNMFRVMRAADTGASPAFFCIDLRTSSNAAIVGNRFVRDGISSIKIDATSNRTFIVANDSEAKPMVNNGTNTFLAANRGL